MKRSISPETSVFLDAARASASIYVVLHHVIKEYFGFDGILNMFRFGQEAVIIFFLMSGFVIFANERSRVSKIRPYLYRRIRRIYPPLIIAFAISSAIAFMNADLADRFNSRELLLNLLSLQDLSTMKPGTIADPYLGNDPLWSLSYEVAFYCLFPLAMVLWRQDPRLASHCVGALSLACFTAYSFLPNHFLAVGSYFSIWWAGAMIAVAYQSGNRNAGQVGPALWWLLAITCIAAVNVVITGFDAIWSYPFLPFRHFLVATIFIFLIFGPFGKLLVIHLHLPKKAVRYLASISYSLYLFHYPLLIQWTEAHTLIGFCFAVLILVVLCHLTERWLHRYLTMSSPT